MSTGLVGLAQSLWRERSLRILDIGARPSEDTTGYDAVLRAGMVEVHAFDVDTEALSGLRTRLGSQVRLIEYPTVLGDGGACDLYITRSAAKSSTLPPNSDVGKQFTGFGIGSEVVERRRVSTVRLDDVPGLPSCDFVKLDTQGSELKILSGGRRALSSALVIQTEVEFVEQYVDQPLFGDVDRELRSQGFVFHTFTGFGTRALAPMVINGDPLKGVNQWLWADAVYILPVDQWGALEPEQLACLAMILFGQYGSVDFAYRSLALLDEKCGSVTADYFLRDVI